MKFENMADNHGMIKIFIITVYALKTFLLYISGYQNISPIPKIMCLLYCAS